MDHPAVARRVLHHGGEHGRPGVLEPVRPHQRGQGLGAQQRRVARQHHHVLHLVVVVGQPGQPDGQGVARAGLGQLLDELDLHGRRGQLDQRLGHPFGPVTHHHDDAAHVDLGHGVEDVEDHRPAAQQVQGLGALRAHPRPLAGGQDHGGEAVFGHRPLS